LSAFADECGRAILLKDTYLIALHGGGSEEDRRLTWEAGFRRYLTKPVDIASVSIVLHRFYRPLTGGTFAVVALTEVLRL
jgi:DNA-binding response OmpR family regulator